MYIEDTDDELFSAVMANSHHVLHHMLPDRTSPPYTLRPRRHDCSLTVKEDARNFVIRLLYKIGLTSSNFISIFYLLLFSCVLTTQNKQL